MSFSRKKETFTLLQVVEITGLETSSIEAFIEKNWICPLEEKALDEEDIARIRLIEELRNQFGANDDAIPLILHLVDQLYALRAQLQRYGDPGLKPL